MKGLGTRGWGLACALALLTFGGLLAQTPSQQPPPTFRTEANYVRVDVFPTVRVAIGPPYGTVQVATGL